ncbi:M48 family metallopeptidase [Fodinisporobacter ferrooxydans]|uniref:M48 family metallopeptidase n=1 Tax=Fodinisporobacter ferrooxydans TaxID=2901836 RepID=A0ABY4CPC6_9BACL|nr:M48 family metallopeptidase [Alicyclobacillaceae bacterium MYW30-H2]
MNQRTKGQAGPKESDGAWTIESPSALVQGLAKESRFYYQGKPFIIQIVRPQNGQASPKKGHVAMEFKDGKLRIIWLPDINRPHPLLVRRVLLEWYKQNARQLIPERVRLLSKRMNLSYNRITLKDQKTRWGSCSSLRNLNFNWRLIMAPPDVLDYVVIHELAHLREMNHSKQFWSIVEQFMPQYRIHKDWLKENGAQLFTLKGDV